MLKKLLSIFCIICFLVILSPTPSQAEYPTCTYTEGMYICYQNGKVKSVYCNYKSDTKEEIEICQNRISENHKYRKYYKNKWNKHCKGSIQKERGEYCQTMKTEFEFYRNEFLNLFLEDLPRYK